MLLFALAVLADPTVTVSFTSTPLPLALKRLSEVSGKTLVASMAFQDEVLMARLKDAPRDEVLRRVADLYLGEWAAQPDGTLILRPDAAKVRAANAKDVEKAAETLRGSLAYIAKRLKEQPEHFGPAEATSLVKRQKAEEEARKKAEANQNFDVSLRPSNANEEAPGWRALGRLLPTLGERDLLAIPPSHRAVWAERNSRLQHPFPVSSRAVFQRYREELAALKPEADVVRVKVVLKRWEQGEAHNASLIAYGPNGETVDTAFIRMANDMERLKTPFSQRFAIPPAGDEKPLSIPADAIEHGHLLNRRSQGQKERAQLVAKWTPALTNPEKYEPTAWLPAVGFVKTAEAMNLNMIGAAQEITGLVYDAVRTETPTQFLTRMKYGVTLEKGGWMTVENPETRRRVSRARAGALLRQAVKQGGLSLDAAADFAAATPGLWPFTNWVGEALGVFFPSGGPRSVLATTHDDTMLRFWNGLGEENHRILRSGQVVSLNRMPPAAAEYLQFMLLHEERLQGEEPTEVFANGISGSLKLEVVETPIFTSWKAADGESGDVVPQDPAEFGVALAKGNAWREIPAEAFRQRDRFRLGAQRVYRFTFQFDGVTPTMNETLAEVFFDPSSPILDRLPDAMAKAIQEARQKAQTEPAKPASGGGTPPP